MDFALTITIHILIELIILLLNLFRVISTKVVELMVMWGHMMEFTMVMANMLVISIEETRLVDFPVILLASHWHWIEKHIVSFIPA